MTETKEKPHEDYQRLMELLENRNVLDKPNNKEKVITRRTIESEIINYTFSDDSEITHSDNIAKSDIKPKLFRSADEVYIRKDEENEEYDNPYLVRCQISTLNPNHKYIIKFEGYITKEDGIVESEPIGICRK